MMDRLQRILRTPLHFSRVNNIRALWVFLIFVLWTPVQDIALALDIQPLGLVVGLAWLVLAYANLGQLPEFPDVARLQPRAFVIAFAMIAIAVFFVLTVPEAAWAQRAASVHVAALGVRYIYVSFRDPETLSRQVLGPLWRSGQVNAVRWMGFFAIGQAIANEIAIMLLSQQAWVMFFALLPIVASILMQLAITATHPDDDLED